MIKTYIILKGGNKNPPYIQPMTNHLEKIN